MFFFINNNYYLLIVFSYDYKSQHSTEILII